MSSSSSVDAGEASDRRRGSWTTSVSLTRFVWAVPYGAVVGDGPRVSCSHAALAVWIRKLSVTIPKEDDPPTSPSADEVMLDWLVTSVRSGGTPLTVVVWFFPVFGELLYDMISDKDVVG